jgi:beta-phosphoglucomutase-like phosphatase (HAD superfamily)
MDGIEQKKVRGGNRMIRALIFDLDGTLVQTEILKANSYARAAVALRPHTFSEDAVIEAFKHLAGQSRKEVAERLLEQFSLEEPSRQMMAEFNVETPWQAFVQLRLAKYEALLADPSILPRYLCPHNVRLLRWAKQQGYLIGLATTSGCAATTHVLRSLNLLKQFDFVATADDVEHAKPDPEIYLLVAKELAVLPGECLAIEDSASGVKAAVAAGMSCIASTSDFTSAKVHASDLLLGQWIVDDARTLLAVVQKLIEEKSQNG